MALALVAFLLLMTLTLRECLPGLVIELEALLRAENESAQPTRHLLIMNSQLLYISQPAQLKEDER